MKRFKVTGEDGRKFEARGESLEAIYGQDEEGNPKLPLSWGESPLIVEDDMSGEIDAAEARAYLASTDWYVIREIDNGTPMPEEIRAARQFAREKI